MLRLPRWLLTTLLVVSCGYVYVRYVEPNCILTSNIRIEHDALANALGSKRLVHLTDLHIDRFGPRERLMIWLVNRQQPDWIVITGDLMNSRQGWPAALEVVNHLKAKHGVWVIAGNTDNLVLHRSGEFDADLKSIGATVLRNQMVPMGDTGAWLIGLDDPITKRARLADTLKDWSPESHPASILLAHAPSIFPEAVAARIPLVLVGHTHGGQVGIPWIRKLSEYADRGEKRMAGRFEEGETVMYVNRGIGWKTAPYRLLASPEIGVIRFVPSDRRRSALPALFQTAAPESAPPGRTRWLSDFEQPAEHALIWNSKLVHASLTPEHATHGRQAARVTFLPRYHTSFSMEDYLALSPARRNWTGAGSFRFEIANVGARNEQLDLTFRTPDKKKHTTRLKLAAGTAQTVSVPLDAIKDQIDLSRVNHVALSLVHDSRDTEPATFIIDAVRLEPRGADEPAAAAVAAPPTAQPDPLSDAAPAAQPPATDLSAAWSVTDPLTDQQVTQIDVNLVGPELPMSAGFVVSGGLPLPQGKFPAGASVRLTDRGGVRWPVQTRPLATWADGSVRWLQVTTQIPPQARGRFLRLDYGEGIQPDPMLGPSVTVEQRPDAVIINTGIMRLAVSKERFTVIESAFVDRNLDGRFSADEQLAGAGDLVVVHRGTEYRSSHDAKSYELTVEESGPLRATLKATGWFRAPDGKGYCQFIVRLQAFAGLPQARLYHTFVYTGYPANPYHDEYKGKPLPENETVEEIRIELSSMVRQPAGFVSADEGGAFSLALEQPLTVSQLAADKFALAGSVDGMADRRGLRSEGWMLVQGASGGVMAGLREAWQQFPNEMTAESGGRMSIKLWPASAGPLDLETGEAAYGPDERARGSAFGLAKTHELTLSFLGVPVDPATARAIAGLWSEPWLLLADPAWVQATDVLGPVGAERFEEFRAAEGMLEDLFEWGQRQQQRFGWYGMLDYGDTMTWYRKDAFDKSYEDWGWHPDGRWGWHNCEAVGSHAGALVSFLRTQDLKYFRFAEAKARHVMDVDTVHHNTVAGDPRLSRVITDAFSKVGSMHRHNAYHWGGRNEEATHTNVAGLLLYFYLTGYDRAWDVANEVGGFLLDNPVTYRHRPHIASLRAISNVLWGDALMYEATGDRRYLREADRWAAPLVRGQQEDGTWLETYNPLLWSWNGAVKNNYIALHALPALVAYHRITGKADAGNAIVRGTDAMIEREAYLPFFEGLAHSYRLTGSDRYRVEALKRLQNLIGYQQHSQDPLRDGMMFDKVIFDHLGPVLYSAPLAIGLAEGAARAGRSGGAGPLPGMASPEGEARPMESLMPGGRYVPVEPATGRGQH